MKKLGTKERRKKGKEENIFRYNFWFELYLNFKLIEIVRINFDIFFEYFVI